MRAGQCREGGGRGLNSTLACFVCIAVAVQKIQLLQERSSSRGWREVRPSASVSSFYEKLAVFRKFLSRRAKRSALLPSSAAAEERLWRPALSNAGVLFGRRSRLDLHSSRHQRGYRSFLCRENKRKESLSHHIPHNALAHPGERLRSLPLPPRLSYFIVGTCENLKKTSRTRTALVRRLKDNPVSEGCAESECVSCTFLQLFVSVLPVFLVNALKQILFVPTFFKTYVRIGRHSRRSCAAQTREEQCEPAGMPRGWTP